MANSKAVKARIESVAKIKKIANALEIVALTRLRRMEARTVASRPFFDKIRELLFDVAQHINFRFHPLLEKKEEIKTVGIIAVFSDKGLCGNFNANVALRISEFITNLKDKKIKVAVVGRKGARYLRRKKELDIISSHSSSKITEDAAGLAKPFIEGFLRGDIDEVYLLYSRFRLHLLGEAKIIKLLPFSPDASFRDRENGVSLRSAAGGEAISEKTALSFDRDYVYEPNAYSLFEALLSEYISNQICHGILESRSAEEMSRMLAMKSASENADEMIGKLKLDYNKTRQAQITKELTEVISAAEAAA